MHAFLKSCHFQSTKGWFFTRMKISEIDNSKKGKTLNTLTSLQIEFTALKERHC